MIKPFWMWKRDKMQEQAPILFPKMWYYKEYGRYVLSVDIQDVHV